MTEKHKCKREIIINCKSQPVNCWQCKDYSLYRPVDRRIKCPRQIKRKQERKMQREEKKNSAASKRGRAAKRKGYSGEHELEKKWQSNGFQARRQPLSGALDYNKYKGDVVVNGTFICESKRRKDAFKTDYKLLEKLKGEIEEYLIPLVCRRSDNKEWMVNLYLSDFMNILKGLRKKKK